MISIKHFLCCTGRAIALAFSLAPVLSLGQPSSMPASLQSVAEKTVHLLYTGNTGGVSRTTGEGTSVMLLWHYLTNHHGTSALHKTSAGFVKLDRTLLFEPEDLKPSAPLGLLDANKARGAIAVDSSRVLVEHFSYIEDEFVFIFQYPLDPDFDLLTMIEDQNREDPMSPTLSRKMGRLLEYKKPSGQRILSLELEGKDRTPNLTTDPLASELWWGGHGMARLGQQQGQYFLVNKIHGGGPRRFQHIQEQRYRLKDNPPFLISNGNEVDTFDNITGKRSSYRDLDFEVLGELKYTALVPGKNELYYGLSELKDKAKQHRLPFISTNLRYRKPRPGASKGAPVFPRYRLQRINGLRVAFIGLVNPEASEQVQDSETLSDVVITDPIEDANLAVREMRRLPSTRPDLVVVLGNLGDKALTDFLESSEGIDIYIGDFKRYEYHPAQLHLDASTRYKEMFNHLNPLLEVSPRSNRVGHILAHFSSISKQTRLSSLDHEQQVLTADLPRSEWLHKRFQEINLRMLKPMESVLIPSLDDIVAEDTGLLAILHEDPEFTRYYFREQIEKWSVWFTPHLWSNFSANVLKYASNADVAAVKELNVLATNTPGPLLELYVAKWLSTEETILLYDLTGAQLRQLATTGLQQANLTGFDKDSMLVGGRPLIDSERYRVALTSAVVHTEAAARILQGIEPQRRFKLKGSTLIPSDKGEIVRLREVAMKTFTQLREQDPGFGPDYRALLRSWLLPQGKVLLPRWRFAAESVTFSFANYSTYPQLSWLHYPGVRETRAVTPSNYTLSLKGTLSAVYDSSKITWDTRSWFELARTVVHLDDVPGQNPSIVKSADDLEASTELQLKFIELQFGKDERVKIIPYTNFTFDTEFMATKNPITGVEYPHQKDFFTALGLVSYPGRIWSELRVAGLMRTDFAAEQGNTDGGVLGGTKLTFPMWLARLDLGTTVRYFFNTSVDTPDKLGLLVQGYAKLLVPFTHDFSVMLGADLFLYRPKISTITDPQTDETIERHTAASLILNAGISFDHLWKL